MSENNTSEMQNTGEMQIPLDAMEEKLSDLRKRIMTLEWDKSHNQLNSSMEAKYAQVKTECEALQKKVDGIKAEMKGQDATAAAAITTATTAEQVKEEIKSS